jgi:16S rRNA (cytidine1402-2'-O)-methyltransferase
MVPTPLGSLSFSSLKSPEFTTTLGNTRFWVAENARTFRRFLSAFDKSIKIDNLLIFELSRDFSRKELEAFLTENIQKGDIGVVSEAGIPGMADPGSEIALWAHRNEISVLSITGPGSIYLALAGSGLNGQQFTFHGYAPMKEAELKDFIHQCEKNSRQPGYTQIFIETPYRSERMFDFLMKFLADETLLCIACNLHEQGGFTKTMPVKTWKKQHSALGKSPCIFLIGQHKKTQSKNSSF